MEEASERADFYLRCFSLRLAGAGVTLRPEDEKSLSASVEGTLERIESSDPGLEEGLEQLAETLPLPDSHLELLVGTRAITCLEECLLASVLIADLAPVKGQMELLLQQAVCE